jgi:hypothetical protein
VGDGAAGASAAEAGLHPASRAGKEHIALCLLTGVPAVDVLFESGPFA